MGVRRGQQRERQLGLRADRVEARRVEHDQTLAQQRVRVVDERMAPGRHLDHAVVVARRVVVGVLVVPEAEGAGLLFGDPLGARHLLEGLGQLVGVAHVELEPAPGARLRPQLAEREAFEAGLDRQQQQRRRLAVVPAELDRAHRGAARRRGQDAAAGVGEEDGVDELRLAARELGHEGDHQLLVAETLLQGVELIGCGALREIVLGEEFRERVDPLGQRGAPPAEGVEAGGERMRHRVIASARHPWSLGRRGMVSQAPGPNRPRNTCSPARHGTFRTLQRRWHPGQKKVALAPWTMRRTVPSPRTQGWPARP